jgi:hypothetical protein
MCLAPIPAVPKFSALDFDRMPPELKRLDNWVLWVACWTGSKWSKRPIQPSGFGASTTNAKHWSSFQEVRHAYELAAECGYVELKEKNKAPERVILGGVGFVFDGQQDENGLVLAGVDFDKVISPKLEIAPLAAERVKRLGSYCEASVSGRGLHVILRARPLPAGIASEGTEVYTRGRYFTMTGRTGRVPRPIVAAPDALEALVEELRAHSNKQPHDPCLPPREPLSGVSDLAAGLATGHWYNVLTPESKDAVVDYALDIVFRSTPLLELEVNGGNNFEYYKLTTAVARSGAPHAEEIFVKYASLAKDADTEDALRQHFSRCAQRRQGAPEITMGTLLLQAEQNGADFSRWKQTNTLPPVTPAGNIQHLALSSSPPSFTDPFAEFVGPPFPIGNLPTTLFDFVNAQQRAMGADPAALAMAALTAVAGSLHAETRVRMGDTWEEKPILWVALVGQPSTMKSPIIDKATKPLLRIDHRRDQLWRQQDAQWQQQNRGAKNPAPRLPKPARSIINDATPEKTAEILSRDPRGALMVHDELAGWLGGFERYSSGASSRAFQLTCWNGGPYIKDRVGHGARDPYAELRVENLALSLLGGIQPDRLSAMRDLTSDGLLQRLLPVLMRSAERGDQNFPATAAEDAYEKLIQLVHGASPRKYQFDKDGLMVRDRMLDYLYTLEQLEGLSPPLIAAIGKLKGYFGRIALVLHVAHEYDAMLRGAGLGTGAPIDRVTAESAEKIVREFVLPHMFGLYDVVVNGGKERDTIRNIASFILASDKDRLRLSDFTSGVRSLRGDKQQSISDWAGRFCAMGWLRPENENAAQPKAWLVVQGLREHFAERREHARAARAAAHEILKAGGSRRTA